jgi:DnaJ-class molecular chaperone
MCEGSGVETFNIVVYEPGCYFTHDSTDERPCPECNGNGFTVEVQP